LPSFSTLIPNCIDTGASGLNVPAASKLLEMVTLSGWTASPGSRLP
jgi:hypothetical protein